MSIKWNSKENIQGLMDACVLAAQGAAEKRFAQLQSSGPQWNIVQHSNPLDDNSPGKVVGQMLDVCGFAWIEIPNGRDPIINAIKKYFPLSERMSGTREGRNWYLMKSYIKGYHLNFHYPLSRRQEMSVGEAAYEAAAQVLKDNGINAYAQSRID